MTIIRYNGLEVLERMEQAVWQVRDRLLRATAALEQAGVEYCVVGGNAVMAWVEQVDRTAVRATQDVNIALRRADLPQASAALAQAGFTFHEVAGVAMFLDGPQGTPRDAVHIVFSGEKVRAHYAAPVPDVNECHSLTTYRVAALEALVRMKLTSFRDKDRTHVRDMIEVGLVDATWPAKFVPELAARLQALLDDPDG